MKRVFFVVWLLSGWAIQISYLKAQSSENYQVAGIAFYNLENLFDTIRDPNIRDSEFLPEGDKNWTGARYQEKLNHLAKVITNIGREVGLDGPLLLGVAEVENRRVLEDLCKTEILTGKNYQIIHQDSPDRRGIDVAFLYRGNYFRPIAFQSHRLQLKDQADFKTRDQLVVSGILDRDTLHVVVNHWPSRSGGEKRSEPRRLEAAALSRHICDSIYQLHPEAKILVMGDFNDDPSNESIRKVMRAGGKSQGLAAGDFFNPMFEMHKKGYGTLAYRDNWQIFDQILLSDALVDEQDQGYVYLPGSAQVFAPSWLKQSEGRFRGYPFRTYVGSNYKGGYSDHFPVYLLLRSSAARD